MAIIKISGYDVVVDDEDVERIIEAGPWWKVKIVDRITDRCYFTRNKPLPNGDRRKEKLHRFLMGCSYKDGTMVDHKNGNTLDCRKENLRVCDNSTNCANKKMDIRNTSGYRGVTWDKKGCKWIASIKIKGKHHYLGSFLNAEEAHKAFLKAEEELRPGVRIIQNSSVVSGHEELTKERQEQVVPYNRTNITMRKDNTSGYRGIYYYKKSGLWKVKFQVNKQTIDLGYLKTKEEAIKAQKDWFDKNAPNTKYIYHKE